MHDHPETQARDVQQAGPVAGTPQQATMSPSALRGPALSSPAGLRMLQRLAGNAAVQRLMVQRQDEATGDPAAPAPDVFTSVFVPDDIVAGMAGMGQGAGDLVPDPGAGDDPQASAQAFFVQRDPPGAGGPGLPAEAPPTKSAEAGDLLSALAAVPEIKAALEKLKQLVVGQWDAFVKGTTTGEKVVTFSVAGMVAAGALAGVGSNAQTRGKGIDLLNGVKLPVPIPGLNGGLTFTPQTSNGQLKGGSVGVDLCKVIPGMTKSPVCN